MSPIGFWSCCQSLLGRLFVSSSFLLYERALFLAEAADPFGSQVSLSDMVALWDESGFSLSPVSLSDLMISLATWSPFETSLGFDWSFDLFRSKDLLSNVVTLCNESRFRLVL